MKRTLSLVLALVIILAMVPYAFAAEDQLPPDTGSMGGAATPIALKELGWIDAKLAGADPSCYYTYTAEGDGSIIFSIASIPAGVEGDIIVTNKTTGATRRLSKDGVYAYSLDLTVNVKAKDVLLIQVTASKTCSLSWTGKFTGAQGSQDNPIYPKWTWNETYTEATAKVTVPVGTSYFAVNRPGMQLTVNGKDQGILTASGKEGDPAIFSITNSGKASATYQLKISWPAGAAANPDALKMGHQAAELAEGSQGYYYTWTAEAAGTLTLGLSADTKMQYAISNLTTGTKVEEKQTDGKPVTAAVAVAAGDVIQILVNTYAETGVAPAGKVTVNASFKTAEAAMRGDVDGKGSVNLRDVLMLLQYVNNSRTAAEVNLPACDVDLNGKINLRDVLVLLQYINGKPFPN